MVFVVYLVCLWMTLVTKSDSSEINAFYIFVATVASSWLLVMRVQDFY